MEKVTTITPQKATKEQRRADVSALLAKRMSYGDVKKLLAEKHGVTQSTIQNDIKAVYELWAEQGREQQAGNLTLAIENCLEEIRRIRVNLNGRPDSRGTATIQLHPKDEYRYSMALLKWESHLAKLQGLLIGRVDVTSQGEPMTVAMNLPAGPFGDLEAV
jgi:hypothetical protein|tara:strand:- start:6760 stop:7242 length:483 start_codon:yes stop_codon:yes gene_type:complete